MKKILVFDMDNVMCDLQSAWLKLYNAKYHENVTIDQIKNYDIHRYVRQGHAIYEFINGPEIFRHLQPIPLALEGLKYLMKQGHKVKICSAATERQIPGKLDWLKIHLPEIKREDIIFTFDKSIVKADFMFDDALHNLVASSCLVPVVFDQPWNQNSRDFIRVYDWLDIIRLVESY